LYSAYTAKPNAVESQLHVLDNDNNHKFTAVEKTAKPNQLKFDLEQITVWRFLLIYFSWE
jgi:hypothetical protein